MPGFLKVDGVPRPIAVPWLKESGAWRPVAIGYVKVEGVWRIWYTAEVVDDFNRPDNSLLGTASDDFSNWTQYTDGWSVSNNAVEHDGGVGPDIASVTMYKATTDVIVEADLVDGTGVGVSWWVSDANNWWAAIPGRRADSNPSFYTCPPDYTLEGEKCRKVETYTASYEADRFRNRETFTENYACCPSNRRFESACGCCYWTDRAADSSTSTSYTCPSGYTGPSSTNRCSTPRYKQNYIESFPIGCISAGSCTGSNRFASQNPNCGTGEVYCTGTRTTCACLPDQVLSCSNCSGNHIVFATATTSTTYSCPTSPSTGCSRVSGPTSVNGQRVCRTRTCDPFDTCQRTVTSCPSGFSSCSSNCNGFDCVDRGRGYYCPQGGSLSGTTCTKTTIIDADFVSAYTTYPSVIRAYQSVNGSISSRYQADIGNKPSSIEAYIKTQSSTATTPNEYRKESGLTGEQIKDAYVNSVVADPSSIQVETVGSSIRIKFFNQTQAQGAPYDTKVFTAGAGLRTASAGIAKYINQVRNQGTRLDNFRAE